MAGVGDYGKFCVWSYPVRGCKKAEEESVMALFLLFCMVGQYFILASQFLHIRDEYGMI